jgi:hypothetical protein
MSFASIAAEGPISTSAGSIRLMSRERELLVTRGYRRLKEVAHLDLPIIDYPLPEVRAEIERRSLWNKPS